MLLVINETPITIEHVRWIADMSEDMLSVTLSEVVKETYRHPHAPENAVLNRIEIRRVAKLDARTPVGAAAQALCNAEIVLDHFKRANIIT